MPAGEGNGQSKLQERDVRAIRLLYQRELYTPTELAALYGVSRNLIHKIVSHAVWAAVK